MKLSIWSSYYVDLSPEEMVCEFEKHGMQYSELSDEHAAELLKRGEPKEVGRRFKAFADSHNVKFTQGHLWLRCRLCDKDRGNVTKTLKSWLDLFYEIGISRAVLHCDGYSFPENTPPEEKYQANISVLRELTDYIKGRELVICLENLRGFAADADELLYIVNSVGGDNIGICLDTGHLNLASRDQQGFIKKAGKHLKALHIADNEGQTDQHIMPFGRGTVDFIGVVRALKEINYDGLFNLEIPGERHCPLEIRGYKIEYIKRMYEYLLDCS
ncbi:MAG: sugar phosphate isomerase/epimerase family protein [Eubacteriales bacterium]|jgi:sugar phosphate isomerase/epimerase|nr:sugar phosphate isomerase/epimerase [Clostridiales bacterium]